MNWIGLGPLLAVATLFALSPIPVGARACDFVDNLVPNCGFDVDLSGWFFTASSFDQIADDGASALGCAAVDRHDGIEAMEAFSACVDVTPSTAYAVGASARLASGALTNICSIQMWEFSDTACTTFVTGPSLTWPLSASWAEIYFGKVTSATTQSAKMRIACFSDVDFIVRIDDAIIFPVVFVDGFEFGNTSSWSSTVP